MVEIRTLKPLVKIRLPQREERDRWRPRQIKVVVRRNQDFPPPTPQSTPCRLWQGVEGTDGYGRRKVTRDDGVRESTSVHRWVVEQVIGRRLRPHEVVLHACDNRLCYRIAHLSIGTVADNNADMRAKGRDSPPPRNVFHGADHPMAKLTVAQVRVIKARAAAGARYKELAQLYGVTPKTVRRIVRGESWVPSSKDRIPDLSPES